MQNAPLISDGSLPPLVRMKGRMIYDMAAMALRFERLAAFDARLKEGTGFAEGSDREWAQRRRFFTAWPDVARKPALPRIVAAETGIN